MRRLPLEAQDYIYTTDNDATITITDYTGAGSAVTIPSTIDGMEVTRIGNGAFRWNTNLSSLTIPTSITSIGDQAFFQCIGLGRVTIPKCLQRFRATFPRFFPSK